MPDATQTLQILDVPNLSLAFEFVSNSYQTYDNPNDYFESLTPVWDWVYQNLKPDERRFLEHRLAEIPDKTKENKTDRILEALAFLRIKYFTEQRKINIASIQEVVQEWEDAEAELASHGDPTTKLAVKFKKISAIRVVQNSTASTPELKIASTPAQIDPRLSEAIAEAFKGIPMGDIKITTFHDKIKTLTEKAAHATPEEYVKITEELVAHVESFTNRPLRSDLKRDILAYFPPPAPFTDPKVISDLESLDTPEKQADYIEKNTASHLPHDQAVEVAKQLSQHNTTTAAKVLDTIRDFSHDEELTPAQTAKLIHEILPTTLETHTKDAADLLLTQVQSTLKLDTRTQAVSNLVSSLSSPSSILPKADTTVISEAQAQTILASIPNSATSKSISEVISRATAIRDFSISQGLDSTQTTNLIQEILPISLSGTKDSTQQITKILNRIIPPSSTPSGSKLSSFTENLIFSKEIANVATTQIKGPPKDALDTFISLVHPPKETTLDTDTYIIAFRTGLSPDIISNALVQAHATTLSQVSTTEYAQKFTKYIGLVDPKLSLTDPNGTELKAISNSILEVLTDKKFESSRPFITRFISQLPKDGGKYIQKTTLDRVHGEVSNLINSAFPTNSPEAQILSKFISPLTRGLSASPNSAQITLMSTVNLLNYLSPQATTNQTLAKLTPLVETLRNLHPEIKLFTSSTSAILQSHVNLTAGQLNGITNQITLRYLVEKPESFQRYFETTFLPQLESLAGIRITEAKSNQILSDLGAHFATNPFRLTPDKRIEAALTSQLTRAGLSPEQARILAPQLTDAAKLSFFWSGQVDGGKNLEHAKKLQSLAFRNSLDTTFASLVETHPVLRQLDFKRLSTHSIFTTLNDIYGNPISLKPDFLVQLKSPVVYSFTKYIEGYVPEPIRPLVTNFAKTVLGSAFLKTEFAQKTGLQNMVAVLASGPTKFRPFGLASKIFEMQSRAQKAGKTLKTIDYLRYMNRYTGMKVAANPVALAFRKNVQLPISNAIGAVWTKVAASKLGQAIAKTALATSIKAATAALAETLGTAAPIVGNIIALAVSWVAGEVISRLVDPALNFLKWVRDEAVPAAVTALLGLGAYAAGVGVLPSIAIGVIGGGLTAGIQSAISGKTIGISSQTVSNAASKMNYVVGSIATAAVNTSFSGVIAAVVALPVVVAFFLFIINSSALVTPPTVYNTGSGGGFQNASSCPLSAGRITNTSYDPVKENVAGAHGTTYYWQNVMGAPYCRFNLPQTGDGHNLAPIGIAANGNTCYQSRNCANPQNPGCSPFYGYAIDIFSSDNRVFIPQVNGQSLTWNYNGVAFANGEGQNGYTYGFTDTTGVYTLKFTHLNQLPEVDLNNPEIIPPSLTNKISGYQITTLFNQGGNTHLHLEFQIDGVYVKPELYFCNGTNVVPTGFVTVNCSQGGGPYPAGYNVTVSNFTNTYKAPGQINVVSRPVATSVLPRVESIVSWGTSRGYNIYVDQGYRNYTEQLTLCNSCQDIGNGCSAERAEYSRHRSGRAIDIYDVKSGSLTSVPQGEILSQFPWLTHPVSTDPPHYCISLQSGDCSPL